MKTQRTSPETLDELPTCNVGEFIENYAIQRGIEYKRSPIDDLAEKITSLSGDDVILDDIEKLLVTLAKKKAITKHQMLRLQLNYIREKAEKDRETRRQVERRIAMSAAESLVASGCTVTIFEGDKILLEDNSDPIVIEEAFHASGEAFLKAKRVIDGIMQEGWIEFISHRGIEVIADKKLKLHEALKGTNELAVQLGAQNPSTSDPFD